MHKQARTSAYVSIRQHTSVRLRCTRTQENFTCVRACMCIVVCVGVCLGAGGFIDSYMHFHTLRACTVSPPESESAGTRCIETVCVYIERGGGRGGTVWDKDRESDIMSSYTKI
jgi:hypothetical protein